MSLFAFLQYLFDERRERTNVDHDQIHVKDKVDVFPGPPPPEHGTAVPGPAEPKREDPASAKTRVIEGKRVKVLREFYCMTREDLSKSTGIASWELHEYEIGAIRIPENRLACLCGALNAERGGIRRDEGKFSENDAEIYRKIRRKRGKAG